jgi:hypothetical protein
VTFGFTAPARKTITLAGEEHSRPIGFTAAPAPAHDGPVGEAKVYATGLNPGWVTVSRSTVQDTRGWGFGRGRKGLFRAIEVR